MRVLLVEDDPDIALDVARALEGAGFLVECAHDGETAWFAGDTEDFDAVVLDLGLPKLDGLSVLRRWRGAGVAMPVLVLTARGTWHEKVEGIDGGADDYLVKPFRVEELLARLRALIRRASGQVVPELKAGSIALDTRSARVTLDGAPVRLTSHEFRVLSYLMHHGGRVVSQQELVEHLYAQDYDRDSNTLEVFIARLRRKLGVGSIETVRGLWRGETREGLGGDGKPVTFSTRPRPIQAELPVWITAGGSPETFRRAGEIGANVLTHLLQQSDLPLEVVLHRRLDLRLVVVGLVVDVLRRIEQPGVAFLHRQPGRAPCIGATLQRANLSSEQQRKVGRSVAREQAVGRGAGDGLGAELGFAAFQP